MNLVVRGFLSAIGFAAVLGVLAAVLVIIRPQPTKSIAAALSTAAGTSASTRAATAPSVSTTLPAPRATPAPSAVATPSALLTTSYHNEYDEYSLSYPPNWSIISAEKPGAATVLTNWKQPPSSPDFPVGGLKIDIYPDFPFPIPAGGQPVMVGVDRSAGKIFVDQSLVIGASDASQNLGSSATSPHSIVIIYSAAGREWAIVGLFTESPDQSNPNTALFYDVVGSIQYGK